MKSSRPTPDQLRAAANQKMTDVLAPDLRVVFCGINPSVYSVVTGHHFARPGNRFYPALFHSGWTPRLFKPTEDRQLLELGLGLTNIAARATVAAAELSREELRAGAPLLAAKIAQFRPRYLAILGVSAYRVGFDEPKAVMGKQTRTMGETQIWVLPNPSGLNAHFPPVKLAAIFREFREAIE